MWAHTYIGTLHCHSTIHSILSLYTVTVHCHSTLSFYIFSLHFHTTLSLCSVTLYCRPLRSELSLFPWSPAGFRTTLLARWRGAPQHKYPSSCPLNGHEHSASAVQSHPAASALNESIHDLVPFSQNRLVHTRAIVSDPPTPFCAMGHPKPGYPTQQRAPPCHTPQQTIGPACQTGLPLRPLPA